jgi:hypothetical protein
VQNIRTRLNSAILSAIPGPRSTSADTSSPITAARSEATRQPSELNCRNITVMNNNTYALN